VLSHQEGDAAVRRFFQNVWNDGEVSQTKEFIADGFVSHNTLDVVILGPDQYGRAVATYRTAFPDLVTTVEDVFVTGDRIAVRGTDRGTQVGEFMGRPATGRRITSTWIEIFRVEDGKAVEGWLETDARHLVNDPLIPPLTR
jgi:predicted ester cyclase